jgi:endonuclease/exonuclease/phosphatase family metal-dependent hydrolase
MKNILVLRGILLTLNLFAAIALTMAILAVYIPPSKHAIFSIFALIYPIIVFINVAFIAMWIVIRQKYWLLSAIIILLNFHNFKNNFQIRLNKNHKAARSDIKAISYNVQLFSTDERGKDSAFIKNNIVSFLKDESADIICLQEYHSMDRNVYMPLIDLKNNLLKSSYYYESYFSPRFDQLSGLIIFSNYKAVNKGKLKFQGSRTFGIYTDLVIEADTVRVYNIHLASIRLQASDIDFVTKPDFKDQQLFKNRSMEIYTKLSEAFILREEQVKTIVNEIKNCSYPIILCGDFNDTPSSHTYKLISTILTDNYIKKGNLLSSTYAGDIPYLRIDYIFTSKDFTVKYFKRHKVRYSDHYPINSVISIY